MIAVAVACGLTFPVGCGPDGPGAERRATVFVAASLRDVVAELVERFEARSGGRVLVSPGASGTLMRQIELGAPCDVFIAADVASVDALAARGRVATDTRRIVAANRLVVAVPRSVAPNGPSPDFLLRPEYTKIAVANPEFVPAGKYARQALERMGLWATLRSKIVFTDDVRAAARNVALGTVDAAVVYATDVTPDGRISVACGFPAETHEPILYEAVLVRQNPPTPLAAGLLAFLTDPEARAIWSRHGFGLPGGAEEHP